MSVSDARGLYAKMHASQVVSPSSRAYQWCPKHGELGKTSKPKIQSQQKTMLMEELTGSRKEGGSC